jgi:hypothetical protein
MSVTCTNANVPTPDQAMDTLGGVLKHMTAEHPGIDVPALLEMVSLSLMSARISDSMCAGCFDVYRGALLRLVKWLAEGSDPAELYDDPARFSRAQ